MTRLFNVGTLLLFQWFSQQHRFVTALSVATNRHRTASRFPLITPNDHDKSITRNDDGAPLSMARLFGSDTNLHALMHYHYGTRCPVHIRRAEDAELDAPPLPSDIPSIVENNHRHATLRLANGIPQTACNMTFVQFQTHIQSGCSAVIPVVHDERFSHFKLALQRWFQKSLSMTIYHSGPGASALPPHTDSYDVLVLQMEGCKDWEIVQGYAETRRATQFTLSPGDVLYIPYNVIHSAQTTPGFDFSTHLTIGLLTKWRPENTLQYSQSINNNQRQQQQ